MAVSNCIPKSLRVPFSTIICILENIQHVTVIGAGYIGLELVETLKLAIAALIPAASPPIIITFT